LICADLERDALVDALRSAVALASNFKVREQNYRNNGLLGGWEQAFGGIIKNLSEEK
jgi:hypothetical protein